MTLFLSAVFEPVFHLAVQDEILDELIDDPEDAHEPEAFQLPDEAVHHAHAHHAVGHLGQRAQRHIILEHGVQVGE